MSYGSSEFNSFLAIDGIVSPLNRIFLQSVFSLLYSRGHYYSSSEIAKNLQIKTQEEEAETGNSSIAYAHLK